MGNATATISINITTITIDLRSGRAPSPRLPLLKNAHPPLQPPRPSVLALRPLVLAVAAVKERRHFVPLSALCVYWQQAPDPLSIPADNMPSGGARRAKQLIKELDAAPLCSMAACREGEEGAETKLPCLRVADSHAVFRNV